MSATARWHTCYRVQSKNTEKNGIFVVVVENRVLTQNNSSIFNWLVEIQTVAIEEICLIGLIADTHLKNIVTIVVDCLLSFSLPSVQHSNTHFRKNV